MFKKKLLGMRQGKSLILFAQLIVYPPVKWVNIIGFNIVSKERDKTWILLST